MSEPYWISWQSLRSNGPGRWSSNHLTLDGKVMLCGAIKPAQVFQEAGLGQKNCPKCERARAQQKSRS